MNASLSVVCYKSKRLSNGESPLMLQVSKGGKRQYQSLGVSVNPKFWDFSKNKPKSNCPNREYILKLILNKQAELQQRMLELNAEQRSIPLLPYFMTSIGSLNSKQSNSSTKN